MTKPLAEVKRFEKIDNTMYSCEDHELHKRGGLELKSSLPSSHQTMNLTPSRLEVPLYLQ